jgi:hypothetical protein
MERPARSSYDRFFRAAQVLVCDAAMAAAVVKASGMAPVERPYVLKAIDHQRHLAASEIAWLDDLIRAIGGDHDETIENRRVDTKSRDWPPSPWRSRESGQNGRWQEDGDQKKKDLPSMPVDTHERNCQPLYGFRRRSCHGIVRSLQDYSQVSAVITGSGTRRQRLVGSVRARPRDLCARMLGGCRQRLHGAF